MDDQSVLITDLEQRLFEVRNEKRALQAEAYLKNKFVLFGMESAVRKKVQKDWFLLANQLKTREERWELIRALFEKDQREFQYVAIDWLNTWKSNQYTAEDGGEFHWILTNKSWWESVDSIASNSLGKWAQLFPMEARKTVMDWKNDSSFWVQRSCLIYQLKYKDQVDIPFLESLIEHLLPNREFFIQKAIGWSLRQLSKFHPEEVRRILNDYPINGLALREASKYLD